MIKRFYITIMALILGISVGFSQSPGVKLNNVTASAGSILVHVDMTNFTTNVNAISIQFNFDPSRLTFTGITNKVDGLNSVNANVSTSGNALLIGYYDITGYMPAGHVFDLAFNYSGNGCTPLVWETPQCSMISGLNQIPNISYTNGTVCPTVGPGNPFLKIMDVTGAPGAVNVPVQMINFTSDINSFTYHFTFDDCLLSFVGVANKIAPLNSGTFASTVSGNMVTVSWFSTTGFTPAGSIFELAFDYKGGFHANVGFGPGNSVSYGTTPVLNVTYVDGSVSPIPTDNNVSVGSAESSSPGTVTLPLHLSGAGFGNVSAFDLFLTYDPAALSYVELVSPAVNNISVTTPSAGVLRLTWFDGVNPHAWTDADLTGLKFRYTGVACADIAFKCGSYLGNNMAQKIAAHFTNGAVCPIPSESSLMISNVTACPMQGVTVPVVATGLGTVGAVEMHISFDNAKLTFVNYTAQQLSGWLFSQNGHMLNFIWSGMGNPATVVDGNLITLQFVNNGGGCAPVAFESGSVVTKPDLTTLNVSWMSGSVCPASSEKKVTISTVSSCTSQVIVPITLTNVGMINSLDFKIAYQAANLTFIGLQNIKTGLVLNTTNPLNQINISWFNTNGVNGDGVIFEMVFDYKFDSQLTFLPGSALGNSSGQPICVEFVDGAVICNNPPLMVGSISADQAVCKCTLPALLIGVPPANGIYPTYQWQSSLDNNTWENITGATSGGTNLNFQPGAICQTTYFRQMQDAQGTSGGPLPTNVVTITIKPDLIVGSISADQTVCAGETPAMLTGIPPANGTNPTYQWQSSASLEGFQNIDGATMLNYQPVSITATTYFRQLQNAEGTCGGPLATNVVMITFKPMMIVGSISGDQSFCGCAIPAELVSMPPTAGGATDSYQWQSGLSNNTWDNVNGATTYSYQWQSSLDNNTWTNIDGASSANYQPGQICVTTYFRQMQDMSGTCGGPLPTNVVTITIKPDLAVGSISADQTFCGCAIPAELVSMPPTAGGATDSYQWQSGLNNNTWDNVNGATTYSYQWQSSLDNNTWTNIDGASSANYQPGQICVTTYFRQMQDMSGTCGGPLPTNVVTITINPLSPVTVSIAATAVSVCAGTAVTYTATQSPAEVDFSWTVNGEQWGENSPTFMFTPNNGDQVQCSISSKEICTYGTVAYSNIITMTVNPTIAVSVAITASANPVNIGTPVTFTASPAGAGTYEWDVDGEEWQTNSSNTFTYTPMCDGVQVICKLTSNEPCTTGNPAWSNTIIMTVNSTITGPATVCNPMSTGAIATYSTESNGNGYNWSVTGGTFTGQGTSSIEVTWPNPAAIGTQVVSVNYTPSGCAAAASVSMNVSVTVCTGTPELPASSSFSIYPIPNKGQFTASIRYPVDDKFTIRVYNMVGKMLFELRDVKTTGGKLDRQIDLGNVGNGMYSVVFMNNESKVVKKMIINK